MNDLGNGLLLQALSEHRAEMRALRLEMALIKDDIEKFVLKGEVTAFSISLNKRI